MSRANRIAACLGLAVGLQCWARPAGACSCGLTEAVSVQFERAAAVFVGRVLSVKNAERSGSRRRLVTWFYDTLGQPYPAWLEEEVKAYYEGPQYGQNVRFEVVGYWKGLPLRTLEVRTGFGGGDCGYPFETGKSYRVYAFTLSRSPFAAAPVAPVEYLSTSICSRTMESMSARVEDLPPAQFKYVAQ